MADSMEKTERATDKRMKEVRSKGQLSKSQDVTAWVGVGAAALMLPSTITHAATAAAGQLRAVSSATFTADSSDTMAALESGLASIAGTVGPLFAVVTIAVLAASSVQGGIHFSRFRGHVEQFNLISGFKKTFGTQALWGGVKSVLKTAVVSLVLYWVIQGLLPVLAVSGAKDITSLVSEAGEGTTSLVQFAVFAGLALAAVDVFVVMKRNMKQTRMSKREVTDENKNSEGDPLIKGQRRARQRSMSRNRMIAAIATADVVLINPTQVAVALKYEPGKSAPKVVAKGSGTVAARIREEADKHGVPMVRDIPLARALQAACEIGEEIPAELYGAVAKVLAFVMHMNTRGSFKHMGDTTTSFLNPKAYI